MYKAAFWILIFVTVITMILQISGYNILESVLFLIIMDFIALWLYLEKKNSLSQIDSNVVRKIENLETACSSILEGIGSVSSVLNLEDKVNKEREDVNLMMAKINEKTLNLEEKLNSFGQSLLKNSNYKNFPEVKEPSLEEN
jgi:c-di-AMP phosphodiesterase-like protein